MFSPHYISSSAPVKGAEIQTKAQQEIQANIVDHQVRQIGDMGMILTAMGIINYSKDWDYNIGLPTILGSVSIIANFYYTHEFRSDCKYHFSNIAKISLLTLGLISFNVIWFCRPLPNPNIVTCERYPDLWACK